MPIQQSSNLPQMTRRSLLTMVGAGVAVYPSLQGAPQGIPGRVTKQTRDLQTSFTNPVVQTEISPKWVRMNFGGETIADSRRVLLLRERGRTPVYYFPEEDVRMDRMTPTDHHTQNERMGAASYFTLKVGGKVVENAAWSYPQPHASAPGLDMAPDLRGYVAFSWDLMDGWYEEGEEVFVHARDPYRRVDVLQSSREISVVLGGVNVAASKRPVLLFETTLPTRYYLPKADVRVDLLRPSDTITRCPYKGEAHYYSVAIGDRLFKDVVWYYRYPTTETSKIANHLAFYNEMVDATLGDGQEIPKPQRPAR